ncbi:MAG: rhodanese-like domain-containing protein [Pseudomonadota bacterium]
MKRRFNYFISMLLLISTVPVFAASELVKSTPQTVPGATTVDAGAAHKLFEEEVAFVDLRKEPAWNAGRIPGAIHLDIKKAFSQESLMNEVNTDEAVVFYCSGIRCPRSAKASEKALSWGYTKVYYFRGGFPAWQTAGYPVE